MKNDEFDFKALRKKILKDVDVKTQKRIKINPVPTREEIYIGAFCEELEPQVKDTIFKMYRKGYSAESSGFYGIEGEFQAIDGYFRIDDITREKLYKIGVLVCKGFHLGAAGFGKDWTQIRFYPQKTDLKSIKKKWDEITEILPDLGCFASPSTSGGAEQFRQKYCPENLIIRKEFLKRKLKVVDLHPNYRKRFQLELKKLSNNKK